MARRGDIAALGVLAALGAGILENKRNKDKVPVESLESQLESKPKAKSSYDEEHVFTGPMEAKKKVAPVKTTAKAPEKTSPGPTRDNEAGMTRGTRPADPRDLERGKTRGRPAEGAPRTTTVTPARAEAPSGDLASQIPGSSPKGWQGGSGERVTGNEFTRNVSNTANALAASPLPGAVAAGVAEAAAAARARRLAAAAKEAEREAVTNPLQWMAGPRGELGRKAMSEADTTGGAIGYKKGGSTKPAAKGWGKARGARQAKYY